MFLFWRFYYDGQLSADYGLTREHVSIDSEERGEAGIEPVDPDKVSGSLREELTEQHTVAN